MKGCYKEIPFARPVMGEEEKRAVRQVLEGPILVHGPRAREFEEDFARYTGAKYAVSVSSCTAALHLAYFYLGIGPGDEVIVPAETHTATAHAVELCGGRPVFVDAEKRTGNIDIDQIESRVTSKTKALSVVHFLGMPVAMDRVTAIAKKHRLFVVEDCALAIGTFYKGIHAGLHGDVGCFSFYPVKHMTTAEGGMLITNREEVAVKVARQKAFGVDRHIGERKIPGVYDVTMLGFNYRMNEIEAVIGIEQLKRMDGFLAKRRQNHEALAGGLRDLEEITLLESTRDGFQSSYYCLSVLLKERWAPKRFEMVEALKKRGIGTSVYYPKPVPLMTYYRSKYGCKEGDFPAAEWISGSSISLPVGPHLDVEDMDFISQGVKEAIEEAKR